MEATTALKPVPQRTVNLSKWNAWMASVKSKTLTDFTLDQLHIQPYQHLLEVGYGNGYTLAEAARQLKIGFIAGIDESVDMYRKAYGRNKKLIASELLELHIGSVYDIAYPNHYFHSIYSTQLRWGLNAPLPPIQKLTSLLKSHGRLVMVYQAGSHASKAEIEAVAEKMKNALANAGLMKVTVEFRDLHPATAICVTGRKD